MQRPSDYKPFPDDGSGFGDYPQLPEISADMKSDWEDWDDPIAKRNFAEPVMIWSKDLYELAILVILITFMLIKGVYRGRTSDNRQSHA